MTPQQHSPADLSAMHAELQAEAATTGEAIARVALRRMRMSLERSHGIAAGTWRAMSPQIREVLVALSTERTDPSEARFQPWSSFTDAERCAIGACAREWARQLGGAQWLR